MKLHQYSQIFYKKKTCQPRYLLQIKEATMKVKTTNIKWNNLKNCTMKFSYSMFAYSLGYKLKTIYLGIVIAVICFKTRIEPC